MTEDIIKERAKTYGPYWRLSMIAQQLKAVVGTYDPGLRALQRESLDMICSKIARILNGDPDYADNWLDISGYALLPITPSENKPHPEPDTLGGYDVCCDTPTMHFAHCEGCHSLVCQQVGSCMHQHMKPH